MIKLNTQGDTSPTMRTVPREGESSFLERLSALAQGAISRFTGTGYAGGSFSRITKMIPAVMLAVFAFSSVSAQGIYERYFENLDGTPSDAEVSVLQAPPDVALPAGFTADWTSPGGDFSRYDRIPGGGTNYALTRDDDDNFVLTIVVPSGQQVTLSSINFWNHASTGGGTNNNADLDITVSHSGGSATTFTSFSNIGSANDRTATPTTPVNYVNMTGTIVITFDPDNHDGSGYEFRLDDVVLNGSISTIGGPGCTTPVAYTINSTGVTCGNGNITLSNSQTGVNYQLYKNNVVFGTPVSGTGSALTPASWTNQGGGVYTVGATTATGGCINDMTGSVTILTNPTNFTTTGGGNICATPAGGTIAVGLTGSESGISYTLNHNGNPIATLAGTGSALSYTVSAAGTYIWAADASASNCADIMNDSAVVTVSQPVAQFAATANNGAFCYTGGTAIFYITGTPNAAVAYTVTGGYATTGTVNINPDGTASITLPTVTANTTVTLNSVTNGSGSTACVVNLTGVTNTLVVRPLLAATITGTQSVCQNVAFSPLSLTIGANGNGISLIRKVVYTVNGGTADTVDIPASSTSTTVTLASLGITNATVGVTNVEILAVYYDDALDCITNYTTDKPTATVTVKELPNFDFVMYRDGVADTLVAGSADTICVPAGAVTFRIENVTSTGTDGSPASYSVVKTDGAPFTSNGFISGNSSSTIAGVSTPAGTYTVTVTNPSSNSCPRVKVFVIREVSKPSFTYAVNGQTVTPGATVQVCAGQTYNAVLTGQAGYGYTINDASTYSGTLSGPGFTYTSPNIAAVNGGSSPVTYTYNVTVRSFPVITGGCDSTFTYYVQVNPATIITGNVSVNGTPVTNNSTTILCERTTASITVTGTPGHTVEIHYIYGSYASSTTFPASGYTQHPTGVIGTNGTYTYTWPTGNYNPQTDASTGTNANGRWYYSIEVKNPDTWCGTTFLLKTKVAQKPSIITRWAKSQPNTTPPVTLPTGGSAADTGTALNGAIVDTIAHCFPGELKLYFTRGTSNVNTLDGLTATPNIINYTLYKDGVPAHTGVSVPSGTTPDFYQFTVNAAAAGLYTLRATGVGATCDSVTSFYVKANPAPVYTKTGVSATTLCEGQNHTVTLTGNAGQNQTYTLTRTSGSGDLKAGAQTAWSGALTSGTETISIEGLLAAAGASAANGTHTFTLNVISEPGTCGKTETFTITVNKKPVPTLKANAVTVTPGAPLTYCQEEEVHYTIEGVPNGATYKLFNGSTQIATGIATNVEASVITLIQQPNTAGTYTLLVQNGATGCDSSFTFTVKVNDRPDITLYELEHNTVCKGDNVGSVTYNYSATDLGTMANPIHTQLFRAGTTLPVVNSFSAYNNLNVTHSALYAGNYTLIVTNRNVGCADTVTFTINEPATSLVLDVTSVDEACSTTNGAVNYTIEGGAAPYFVQAFVGNTTTVVPGTTTNLPTAGAYSFTNLAAGTYTIYVRDYNGCIRTQTVVVKDCADADLFAVTSTGTPNFSVANDTEVDFTLDVYNAGQSSSNGEIELRVTLPAGFTLTGATGWVVTKVGPLTVLKSSVSVPSLNKVTINAKIEKTGTPATGFFAVITTIVPGSGGDNNDSNNSTVSLLNVTQ